MSIDPTSVLIGFALCTVLQRAFDRAIFKIFGRVLSSSIGKRAVLEGLHDALTKLGEKDGAK